MHGIEEANLLPLAQKQNQFLVRINCEPKTQKNKFSLIITTQATI